MGTLPTCAIVGCPNTVRADSHGKPARYCSPEHADDGRAIKTHQRMMGVRNLSPQTYHRILGERATSRAVRQQPGPPPYRLTVDSRVKIRPPLPAPESYDADGVPMPFLDDGRAILDHGSPGRFSTPDIGQARVSPLGAIVSGDA